MTYRLRDDMTSLKSRKQYIVEVKRPQVKQYSECVKYGGKAYPIFEGLKNPDVISKYKKLFLIEK